MKENVSRDKIVRSAQCIKLYFGKVSYRFLSLVVNYTDNKWLTEYKQAILPLCLALGCWSAGAYKTLALRCRSAGACKTLALRCWSAGACKTVARRCWSAGACKTQSLRCWSAGACKPQSLRYWSAGARKTQPLINEVQCSNLLFEMYFEILSLLKILKNDS